jgi:signal transduction histidine kinase
MRPRPRSLRTELLVDLGFVTSAAVVLVGLTTLLLAGGDLRETYGPLVALWLGSTAVFLLFGAYVLHRAVVGPVRRLMAEADALAAGDPAAAQGGFGSIELDRLAARYRAMAEELLDVQTHVVRVEKLAGIGRLAAGVAHEVRNPLGALANYVEVLQRRGAEPAVTTEMRRAIERIERIVQGLVDYARPGRRLDLASAALVDLNGAVRTVLDFLGAQGMLRSQRLELALAPDLPPVRGDRHLLEQVVVNLVANACQASPGGRVVVGTAVRRFEGRAPASRERDTREPARAAERVWAPRPRPRALAEGTPGVVLYVADDGPGVPEENRERIFDPFFTTKDPGKGTGLGLAIVARTVHESGGIVWVDRAREGGAVFKLFLPLAGD